MSLLERPAGRIPFIGGKPIGNVDRECVSYLAPGGDEILKGNVGRLGASIVRAVHHDWTRNVLPEEIVSIAPFDRILLDAPCTNTGVIRRRIDVRWRLRPEDFSRMSKEQLIISRAVFRLLKPGGILVYSTCSLESEENEKVVRRARTEVPALALEAQKDSLPFRDGFDGAFAAKLSADVAL